MTVCISSNPAAVNESIVKEEGRKNKSLAKE